MLEALRSHTWGNSLKKAFSRGGQILKDMMTFASWLLAKGCRITLGHLLLFYYAELIDQFEMNVAHYRVDQQIRGWAWGSRGGCGDSEYGVAA